MGSEVTRKCEPVSRQDAADALRSGFVRVFGRQPSDEELQMFVAHTWGIELGHGKSSCNNALGNVIATDKWKGDYWRPPWYADESHPLHDDMLRGEAPAKFRAYTILEDGAHDYFKVLKSQFPQLLVAAWDGDTQMFAQNVKDSNYTPGIDVASYKQTLDNLLQDTGESGGELGPIVVVGDPPKKKSGFGLLGLFGIVGGLGAVALVSSKKGKRK